MKPADKPKKVIPVTPKAKPGKSAPSGPNRFTAILFNVGGAILAGLFIMFIFQHHEPSQTDPSETHFNSGYDWLLNSMLKNNLETIEKNPDKTIQERYLLKWGTAEIVYIDSMKKLTPDTAILMLPPKSVTTAVGFKSMVDLPWVVYFLYPRRVVYGDSIHDPLYDKADYLVSINGWGLDKVKTPVEKPAPFLVLPLHK